MFGMVLNTPDYFKFFIAGLSQILVGPFLNTLTRLLGVHSRNKHAGKSRCWQGNYSLNAFDTNTFINFNALKCSGLDWNRGENSYERV